MGKRRKRNKRDVMYAKYGEHSPGVFCGGCRNCQKRERDDGKWTWKCIAYGVTGTYETDWSPMFNACGYFNMPFSSFRDTPAMETETYRRIMGGKRECKNTAIGERAKKGSADS